MSDYYDDEDWGEEDGGYAASLDVEDCCVDCDKSALDACCCCGSTMCPQCYECSCGFCNECMKDPNFADRMAAIYAEMEGTVRG